MRSYDTSEELLEYLFINEKNKIVKLDTTFGV
jgi:hypothetical protein